MCLCVCVSEHFRFQSPNGWTDRDRPCTVRNAGAAVRRWCQSRNNRCYVQTFAKINRKRLQAKPGTDAAQIYGPIATMGGSVLLGWRLLGTCERHVNSDFTCSLLATERFVQSGPGKCHLTQFKVRKKTKSVAVHPVPYGTWHVILVFCILRSNDWSDGGGRDTVRLGQTVERLPGQL